MNIIGEKINGTRTRVAEAIINRDADLIKDLAQRQVAAGSTWLDINAGTHPDKEPDDLVWLIETVQSVVDVPLTLDSANPEALKMGLQTVKRTPMINSISGEPDRLKRILPLVAEHGCEVIALAMDAKKIPETYERRMEVIKKVLPKQLIDGDTRYFINPTGRFVVGGPMGDCGLTGRKIIVDTYGGQGSHGGGCFSGKDPSKVDRSASYMGRYIAKNLVAAGLAKKCEVQIAYAIGVAQPVSIMIDFMGTGKITESRARQVVSEVFDLRPAAIIENLDLLRPIYQKTSAYGHFGREDADFTWEHTNKVDQIKDLAGL